MIQNDCIRFFALAAAFLIVVTADGQQTCNEEVKLLLSPAQVQAAIPALHAGGETQGRVYFYDTTALDLLSKGVILRLREGRGADLTVKLRPLSGERFDDPTAGRELYVCELDLNDGIEAQSFSVQQKYLSTKPPETGDEVLRLLSEGQKKLLDNSKVQIDWKRVKRVAEIRSTSWTRRAKGPLGKLDLELWEWPNGSILEVSTKVATNAGQATYVELQKLAKRKDLALSTKQSSKTELALRSINPAH